MNFSIDTPTSTGIVRWLRFTCCDQSDFFLLDPVIFRHVIDGYATRYHDFTQAQFIRGAGLLLLAAVGVAFGLSRSQEFPGLLYET